MAAGKVIERDLGWRKLKAHVKGTGSSVVAKVGVQGSQAEEAYEDGPTNIVVMSAHEFGLGRVPERSPMRSTFDLNRKKYEKEMGAVEKRFVEQMEPLEAGVRMLGETYRGDIDARIRAGEIEPPLSEAYFEIKRPQEPAPLLRTGQLVGSLSVEMEIKR